MKVGTLTTNNREQQTETVTSRGTNHKYTDILAIITVVNLPQKVVQRVKRLSARYDLSRDKFKITDRLAVSTGHTLYFKTCVKRVYLLSSSTQYFEGHITAPKAGVKKASLQDYTARKRQNRKSRLG